MDETLADYIEKRIRKIPSSNPGFISVRQTSLGDLLDKDLLRFIALEAADAAKTFTAENRPADAKAKEVRGR